MKLDQQPQQLQSQHRMLINNWTSISFFLVILCIVRFLFVCFFLLLFYRWYDLTTKLIRFLLTDFRLLLSSSSSFVYIFEKRKQWKKKLKICQCLSHKYTTNNVLFSFIVVLLCWCCWLFLFLKIFPVSLVNLFSSLSFFFSNRPENNINETINSLWKYVLLLILFHFSCRLNFFSFFFRRYAISVYSR